MSQDKARPPPSMMLATAAWKLFGDNWQRPLERLIGVPQKTLSRILHAGTEGRDYRGSTEALEALAAKLKDMAAETGKTARAARRRSRT